MIILMTAAALADISAGPARDQGEWTRVQAKAGAHWTLPDLDYGDGPSCPPRVERELTERMTFSIGPDCGERHGNRPDPIGPSGE